MDNFAAAMTVQPQNTWARDYICIYDAVYFTLLALSITASYGVHLRFSAGKLTHSLMCSTTYANAN